MKAEDFLETSIAIDEDGMAVMQKLKVTGLLLWVEGYSVVAPQHIAVDIRSLQHI